MEWGTCYFSLAYTPLLTPDITEPLSVTIAASLCSSSPLFFKDLFKSSDIPVETHSELLLLYVRWHWASRVFSLFSSSSYPWHYSSLCIISIASLSNYIISIWSPLALGHLFYLFSFLLINTYIFMIIISYCISIVSWGCSFQNWSSSSRLSCCQWVERVFKVLFFFWPSNLWFNPSYNTWSPCCI